MPPELQLVPCGFLRDTIVMDLHNLRFAELQTHGIVHHRSGHCAAVYGSEMFVLGGIGLEVHETQSVSTLQDGQTERTTSYLIYEVVRGDFVKLDIPSRTWYSVPMEHKIRSDIPSPRWGHRMTRYGDGLSLAAAMSRQCMQTSTSFAFITNNGKLCV